MISDNEPLLPILVSILLPPIRFTLELLETPHRMIFLLCIPETLTRLLIGKGIFTKEVFFDMVKVVDREMKRKKLRGMKIN
jgi:hypothetical protein